MKSYLSNLSVILLVTLAFSQQVIAEGTNQADAEFMRMLQQRAAQARFEEELKNPKNPPIQKGRAVLGKSSAPITIVEYSDFQCPYCREGYLRVEAMRAKYGEKIRFAFKHLPLPFHPLALPAAKRFEAINLQSSKKAYEYHDIVFKEQDKLNSQGEAFLDDAAKRAGANVAKMKQDMESEKVKKNIDSDMAEAKGFGIEGTPGFIVAGVTVSGAQPIELFNQIIDQRLATPRAVSSKKK